jgi:hypothetical protein
MDEGHTRPPNVPAEAFYIGGSDGGVYIQLKRASEIQDILYQASIFSDQSGKRLFDGLLKLMPADSPPIDPSDTAQFAGWAGAALYLADGRKLLAIADKRSGNVLKP